MPSPASSAATRSFRPSTLRSPPAALAEIPFPLAQILSILSEIDLSSYHSSTLPAEASDAESGGDGTVAGAVQIDHIDNAGKLRVEFRTDEPGYFYPATPNTVPT